MSTCMSVPVSWPRLERLATGATDADATAHVEACEACRACLQQIREDVVALPALPPAVEAPRRRRAWLWAPAFGSVAIAAAVLFLLVRPRPEPTITARVHVKGAGDVVLTVVRERAGAVSFDPTTFRGEDRFKVRVTCDPGADVWADVLIVQGTEGASYPFAAAESIPCGNGATVPGAFRLTGRDPARICVALSHGDAPPVRGKKGALACATVSPE